MVTHYVQAARNASFGPVGPAMNADLRTRIKRVLAVLPYNATLWHELAALMVEGQPTLAQSDAAGRAADNAFYYSGLSPDELYSAIYVLLSQVMTLTSRPKIKDTSGLDAAALAKRDMALSCPLLRDLRLAMTICTDPMHFGAQCLHGGMMDLPMGTLMAHLTEAAARSGCKSGELPIDMLLPQSPAPFDLLAE